ncbi:NDR1/HIN1-Like protein [Actinidia chinensis var. chinensis]|uniref:NDR1/HIN1-Like protein n=1 Tax=Actinidia chinensis var. chinensis TaxID=1590841 RepID=A0A2R6REU6_ACTCC|nr:NDR1/HIN1-Like protein [Actinidia chinensis var. chinensis]
MSRHHEANPHFLTTDQRRHREVPHRPHQQHDLSLIRPPRQQRRRQNQNPQPQHGPTPQSTSQPPPPHHQPPHSPNPHFAPLHQTPQTEHPQPHHGPETHFPRHQQPQHLTQHVQPHHLTQPISPHGPRMPAPPKTGPHTWLIGAFCALFWIAIFLAGLVVLIVYLMFRPRSPKFDVSSASLNTAYLDMGYLLNADMTLLANFTNPSKKATVDFHYVVINLYYDKTLIATTYVDPFSAMKAESNFRNVHLVSSQVRLPLKESQQMQQQIESNRIRFEVKGLLKTRSNLGSFFRYSYWLYGHCIIEVTGPPSGVLVGKKCVTKR